MSSVFLFGAGASYGSMDCYPHPPPLGCKLFRELQKAGGVAASIEPSLSTLFEEDFEKGMAEFRSKRNVETTAFLREMSLYFAKFAPGPDNLYGRVIKILKETKSKAIFVTTNYDLLIELAILRAGYKYAHQEFPVPVDNIPVLKIHGSCNFLPTLPPRHITNIGFDVGTESGATIMDIDVSVATPYEVIEFCRREDSIAPAIAVYAKGKQILFGYRFVDRQQQAWQLEVKRASKIYVIGLRVNPEDTHIWGALKSAKAPLHYVGGESDEFIEWKNNQKRKQAYIVGEKFEEAIPHIKRHLTH